MAADSSFMLVERLVAAGHRRAGDPQIWIVADAGYDLPRLAFVLADLPVTIVGRLRSDRVLHLPAPTKAPGSTGRRPGHGDEFALARPETWPAPAHSASTATAALIDRLWQAYLRGFDLEHASRMLKQIRGISCAW